MVGARAESDEAQSPSVTRTAVLVAHLIVAAKQVLDALVRLLEAEVHAEDAAQLWDVPTFRPIAAAVVAAPEARVRQYSRGSSQQRTRRTPEHGAAG